MVFGLGSKGRPRRRGSSRRRSLAQRYLARQDNPANFEGRTIFVGNRRFVCKQKVAENGDLEDNDEDNGGEGGEDDDEDFKQVSFVSNTIKSSKYTWYNFVFKNLYEQFRRLANFYFLVVAVIQLSIDSPVSPFTSISPLVFVVLVTMIKQGYEDFKRHRADGVINHKMVTRIGDYGAVQIKAEEIKVGDILCIEDGDEFPCDMVLLSTSNKDGKASIMTANLDGETNLKNHFASTATRALSRPDQLQVMHARIECENPNQDLTKFVGRIVVRGNPQTFSLSLDNAVLRGTQLKNTDYIFGCAVYTGIDTKMSMNSQQKGNKFSTIEVTLNRYLLFFVGLLIFEIVLATSLKYSYGVDRPGQTSTPWYLGPPIELTARQVFEDSLSFLILFNYIIPISLYVTLEMQKFIGSMFLAWDLQLYDAASDQPAKVNTSDLNEELGQVQYLFSDKTGTLTQNVMIFRECSVQGSKYRDEAVAGNSRGMAGDLVCMQPELHNKKNLKDFLKVLALCHTVQASRRVSCSLFGESNSSPVAPADLDYNASSPDEKAIVEACRSYGVAFMGDSELEDTVWYTLQLSSPGSGAVKTARYQKLHVLEFDSDRKCMSIILRDDDGETYMMSKGAESSILPKCRSDPQLSEVVSEHINEYASRGLRTLAVAVKKMEPADCDRFFMKYSMASQALDNREERVRQVYNEAEDDMILLGAIGVEDKLQENVKETLVALGDAGIKVWILTGDKKETAINISHSCGHFLPGMTAIDICSSSSAGNLKDAVERVLKDKLEQCELSADKEEKVLIVDGATLTVVFAFKEFVAMLRDLASHCRSVICCRMSPLQKADIVRMIKESPGKPITASVGDGANDVAMIQEAHVGLGIVGKEGRAAVRASDFAFAKFRCLQRLFLVHGHWYYYRVAHLVQYFFFKNVAGFLPQLYFAFYSNFSTQSLFESVNLTLYNITFTSLPIYLYGLFEQNRSADYLLRNPSEYRSISRNSLLSLKRSSLWFTDSMWLSFVNFFTFYLLWSGSNQTSDSVGATLERVSFGFVIYQGVLFTVHARLIVFARHWNGLLFGAVVASLLFFWCFTLGYQGIVLNGDAGIKEPLSFEAFWVMMVGLRNGQVWLTFLLNLALASLPYIAVQGLANILGGEGRSQVRPASRKLTEVGTSANGRVATEDMDPARLNGGRVNLAYENDYPTLEFHRNFRTRSSSIKPKTPSQRQTQPIRAQSLQPPKVKKRFVSAVTLNSDSAGCSTGTSYSSSSSGLNGVGATSSLSGQSHHLPHQESSSGYFEDISLSPVSEEAPDLGRRRRSPSSASSEGSREVVTTKL